MNNYDNIQPVTISINELLQGNDQYIIPIYQRNYAWTYQERIQLLEDIKDATTDYYLGNLIVYQRDFNKYEVIDGQQRLTTLYILLKVLSLNDEKYLPHQDSLWFEARKKSNDTLLHLTEARNEYAAQELVKAYDEFLKEEALLDLVKEKISNVKLLRITVPKDTDLNHYFEIMNSRGKQLEPHEILKAKLMSKFENSNDRFIFAKVWDAVSNMDKYIQMSFNPDDRKIIFGNKYDRFLVKKFNDIYCLKNGDPKEEQVISSENDGISLSEAIFGNYFIETAGKEDAPQRFESIISFPHFLLHSLTIFNHASLDEGEQDYTLDDKRLLQSFEVITSGADSDTIKEFLFLLLKLRFLFDQYIIKRDYSGKYRNDGEWSIKKLLWDNNNYKHNDTFEFKHILMIQSMFRVTYTAPQTMHWLTIALKYLNDALIIDEGSEKINENDFLDKLEDYATKKVKASKHNESNGFNIQRIVFMYLDYLIWRIKFNKEDNAYLNGFTLNHDKFSFSYRNSIEHFYPQHPIFETNEGNKDFDIDSLGNLCLLTVSSNSKFSNLPPFVKVKSENIVNSSLKLRIMAELAVRANGEDAILKDSLVEHREEMMKILDDNCRSSNHL